MPKHINVHVITCNNGYVVTNLDTGEQYVVTTISRDYTSTSLSEVLRSIEDTTKPVNLEE